MAGKKFKTLNWDDFQKLGNPDNAPQEPVKEKTEASTLISRSRIRIHLEKKGRGGKSVSIVRGLEMTNSMMKEIEKGLKSYCGVGGTQKHGEIILQGDHRDKIISYLKSMGARDIKKAGA